MRSHRMARRALFALVALTGVSGQSLAVNLSTVGSTAGSGFRFVGSGDQSQTGFCVSGVADFDGDGLSDFVFGAPLREGDSGVPGAGLAGLVPGRNPAVGEISSTFVSIRGNTQGLNVGWSASAAGDLNADGHPDFLFGVPRSPSGLPTASGAVYVYTFGAPASYPISEFGSRQLGAIIGGSESGSGFGHSVAPLGDFNGDGVDDVAIGAPYATSGADAFAGKVYVLFGSGGIGDANGGALEQGSGGVAIASEQPFALLGSSVSGIGDINNDGLADLLVGAPGAGMLDRPGCGVAYVIFGRNDGAAIDINDVQSGLGGFALIGAEVNEEAGLCVSAAGDVNGDARPDLLIGADSAETGGTGAGRCYVVFGTETTATLDLSAIAKGSGGFVLRGAAPGDHLGSALSFVGDVDGDGLADFLVGAPGTDAFLRADSGIAYLIHGKPTTEPILVSDLLGDATQVFYYSDGIASRAGQGVAGPGDLNGDGTPDVLIGAPNAQSLTNRPGKIYAACSASISRPSSSYRTAIPFDASRKWPLSFAANGALSPPDARAWLSMVGTPEAGGSKTTLLETTITRTRDDVTPSVGTSLFSLARVHWRVGTPDAPVTWSGSRITLCYTSAEVAGLVESSIRIAHGPSLAGPWSYPENQEQSNALNLVSADMPGPGYFILVAQMAPPVLASITLTDRDGLNDPVSGWTNETTINVSYTIAEESVGPPISVELSSTPDFSSFSTFGPGASPSFTFPGSAEGKKTLYARLNRDGGIGNVVSGFITFDRTPPTVTFNAVITTSASPSLSASVTDGNYIGRVDVTVDSRTYQANGVPFPLPIATSWSASVGPLLEDTYDVDWRAVDGAGNVTQKSYPRSLLFDLQPPVVTIDPIETRDVSPHLSGAWSDADDRVTFQLVVNGSSYSPSIDVSARRWILAAKAINPPLADGTYDVTVTARDRGGRTGTDSSVDEVVIDTTPPKVIVLQRITNDHRVALSGEIEDARQIAYVTAAYNNTYWFPQFSNGEWSFSDSATMLPDGSYDFDVIASDRAGNIGTDTTTSDLIIDSVALTCEIVSAPAWSVDEDVTITLQVTNPSAGAVTELGTPRLYARTERGTWQATDAACSGDAFRWRPNLGSGRYFLQSVLSDAAGNSSSDPSGLEGTGQATLVYNDRQNGALTLSVGAGSSSYFPMSATAGVIVDFSDATEDSDVTVAREVPPAQVPPDLDPALVIPEALVISGSLAGTASLVWSTDFAADAGLPAPLDTVFQAETGRSTVPHAVTVEANDLRVEGITGFSTWYAGSRTALATSAWTLY